MAVSWEECAARFFERAFVHSEKLHTRGYEALRQFSSLQDETSFAACSALAQQYKELLEQLRSAFEQLEGALSLLSNSSFEASAKPSSKLTVARIFEYSLMVHDAFQQETSNKILMLDSLQFSTAQTTLTAYEAAWQSRVGLSERAQLAVARDVLSPVFPVLGR
eukprot:m.173795 g.173795  ORF g.173795 m.173795 type:complete len:164 (-) comp53278_c0_seq1:1744-2235(-)